MYKFSKRSINKLNTIHPLLRLVFTHVIMYHDCTIIEGHRGKVKQNHYFKTKKSKLQYPNSKHNSTPSLAVDVTPYIKGKGIVWDKEQCYVFAGYVMGIAGMLHVSIRSGIDWDMDTDIHDQSFLDLCHYELREI